MGRGGRGSQTKAGSAAATRGGRSAKPAVSYQAKADSIRAAYLVSLGFSVEEAEKLSRFSLAEIDSNPNLVRDTIRGDYNWESLRKSDPFDDVSPAIAAYIPTNDPEAALAWYRGDPKLIPTPEESCPGTEAAAEFLLDAFRADKKIALFCDYDVDGITAGEVLTRAVRPYGEFALTDYASPTDGFGLTEEFVRRAAAEGCEVLVTVDCGSADNDAVALAQELGMKVVVTDHHRTDGTNPADYHINPQLHGSSANIGAQVAWKVGAAIQERADGEVRPEHMEETLYLAAFGCNADWGPVKDPENRAFYVQGSPHVPLGVRRLAERLKENPEYMGEAWGTQKMLDMAKRTSRVTGTETSAVLRAQTIEEADAAIDRLKEVSKELDATQRKAKAQINQQPAAYKNEAGETVRPNPEKHIVHEVFEDPDVAGSSGTLAQTLATRADRPGFVFVRNGVDEDGEPIYKFSSRPCRIYNQKLGELIENEEMKAATTTVGGHADLASGECRGDQIEEVIRIAEKWASTKDDFYTPRVPDVSSGKSKGAKSSVPRISSEAELARAEKETIQLFPFNASYDHIPPKLQVKAEVVGIEDQKATVRFEDGTTRELSFIRAVKDLPSSGDKVDLELEIRSRGAYAIGFKKN